MVSKSAAILRLVAVCLYVASLFLVPFHTSYPNLDWWGVGILLLGWLAVPEGVFAWLANPLGIFSMLRMNRSPRTCVVISLCAVLLALDSYKATRFSFGFDSRRDTIAGQIHGLGLGTYVWFCSLILTLLASALHLYADLQGREVERIALRKLRVPGALLAAVLVALYALNVFSNKAENQRLGHIVEAKLDTLELPPGSRWVYQETEASRACKSARASRLFASDLDPTDVCASFAKGLPAEEWRSHLGCRAMTYPSGRAPLPGERAPYSYSMFAAGTGVFGVFLTAKPREAWGHLFMLSSYGEDQAVPLARQLGRTFFTVSLSYSEDRTLYQERCPEASARCDCVYKSLYTRRFADGRQFSRSE